MVCHSLFALTQMITHRVNKLLLFFNLIEEKECENGVHFFVCADIDKYNKLLLFFNLLVQFIPSLFEFVAFIR